MAVSVLSLGALFGGSAAAQDAAKLPPLPPIVSTSPPIPLPPAPTPPVPTPTQAPVATTSPVAVTPPSEGPLLVVPLPNENGLRPSNDLIIPPLPPGPSLAPVKTASATQSSRDPLQPLPPGPTLAPAKPSSAFQPTPVYPATPAEQSLGTIQVSPPYTGPVVMPTTQPPAGSGNTGVQSPPMSPRQRKVAEEGQDYNIQLEFPGLKKITKLESEAALKERMRNEFRRTGERISFPEEQPLSRKSYQGRHWAQMVERVEPHYLNYGRLYFEQPNYDRYAWDLGPLGPLVQLSGFYADVFLLPYLLGTRPFDCTESSAGRCLPGDSTPLVLYPPELSVTGLLAETGAIVGGFFVFP